MKLDFFRPREKFLLLELAPRKTTGILLAVDGNKKITLEKFWDEFAFKGREAHPIQNLKKRKLIVSADSALTTTISFPVELARQAGHASRPVSIEELENLLAQSVGKTFSRERAAASTRLGRDELDTILVNAKAEHFKIERHKVMNPVGFKGKTIEAVLELTFTTREIFESLKPFFNAKEGFFFTETSRAALHALIRFEKAPLGFIAVKPEGSTSFMLQETAWGTSVLREKLNWPLSALLGSLASAIPADHEVILEIYDRHLNKETADHFSRALMKIMKPQIERFFSEIRKSKLKGRAYLHSSLPLPISLPFREGRVEVREIPLGSILQRSGFVIEADEWPFSDGDVFMRLAPFLEFYYDKSDSEINHKLRRRVHWLIQ